MSQIREDVLHCEADEAYEALSVLLGDDQYFFNERYMNTWIYSHVNRRPGLLDAAVFAYTWTILDKLGDSHLAAMIKNYDNIVNHAHNVKNAAYLKQE